MKRIVSYLLAAVMVLTPCMNVYATEPDSVDWVQGADPADDLAANGVQTRTSDTEDRQNTEVQPTVKEQEEAENSPSDGGPLPEEDDEEVGLADEDGRSEEADMNKGQIDVYIAQTLEWDKPVAFDLTLSGQGYDTKNKKITLPSEGIREVQDGVTFDNLAKGVYELQVSAPGFANYRQQIQVGGWAYKVSLATGFLGGYDYGTGGKHPGTILIGDVNGDGAVTAEDETRLIDLIDGEAKVTQENERADFNRDGKFDLTDLDYFAQGYKENQALSLIEQHVPAAAISQKPGEGTNVEGSLEDLSRGEGAVILTRKDGAQISSGTPVTVDFEILQSDSFPTGGIVIDSKEDNPIDTAVVGITYTEKTTGEDGKPAEAEHTIEVPVVPEGIEPLLTQEQVTVKQDGFGKIIIDLGSQVAVKKVTIKITGMKKNNNLAEIAKVEFIGDMANRIPEPQRDIPEGLASQAGNKKFTLTWNKCVNVTGYEVQIENEDGEQEVIAAKGNILNVSSFKQNKLVNGKEYTVRVQSVNGAWRSGYSAPIVVVPKVDKAPDAPDRKSVV